MLGCPTYQADKWIICDGKLELHHSLRHAPVVEDYISKIPSSHNEDSTTAFGRR